MRLCTTFVASVPVLTVLMLGWTMPVFGGNPPSRNGGIIEEYDVADGQQLVRWDTEPYQGPASTTPPVAPRHRRFTPFEYDDPVGTLLWQHSDPTGIGNDVAVADYNNYFGIGYYLNNERMVFFQRSSNVPLWQYQVTDGGTYLDISGDGQIVMFSNMAAAHRLDPVTGNAIWDFPMPAGYTSGKVDVARDGSLIVLLGWGPSSGNVNRVWAFHPQSSTPIWSFDVDASVAYGWYGVTICNDNSRVAVNGKFHMYVLDAQTGDLMWDDDTYNTESPARLSGDGTILTSASLSGKLRVFYWDDTEATYLPFWEYTFTGGTSNWASTSGVSDDGSTIATGSLQFLSGGYAGYAAVFNTYGNGVPLWISSDFGDMVGDCALSDDGLTVAFVSWGDMANTIPDLQVFEKYTSTPFFTINSPGSLNDVDLSADGSTLIAGGKAVHNRQFGNGGNVYTVDLNLGGGTVTGTVTLTGESNHSGVRVYAVDQNRETFTDSTGAYTLRNVPAGNRDIRAQKLGFTEGLQFGITVIEGATTPDIDFTLAPVGAAPTGLSASQGLLDHIDLTWNPYPMSQRDRQAEIDFITGADPTSFRTKWSTLEAVNPPPPQTLETDQADSFHVYRSRISGGPYALIASVDGSVNSYTDDFMLLPTYNYYYVITAIFSNGESEYSNQAVGFLDDSYLVWDIDVPQSNIIPAFDGVISAGEWDDAIMVDISDVFGYDSPDPPGSAYMYMKFNDTNDSLYIAAEDFLNTTLNDNEGIGFYVDDNDNDEWDYSNPGSEGNYWVYYYTSGPTVRYRSLSGGEWSSNYYVFPNPQVGFSDASGHVQCEVALPLGFRQLYQIGLHGPDKSPGIGAFIIEQVAGVAVFHGWWPQNMYSIVSYPSQFADCGIDCQLLVPPAAPPNIAVVQSDQDLLLNWDDPTIGVDSLPLANLQGIHIYRNGELYDSVDAGVETYLDQNCAYGGWYGYGIAGYVQDQQGPLEGVISRPVGAYAGETPAINNIIYDDGGAEAYYVVSFSYDGNLFGIRFSPQSYPVTVYTLDIITNGTDEFDFAIYEDDGGLPGRELTDPMPFSCSTTLEFNTFHLPGTTPPTITTGDFWVIIAFRPDTPGYPGIGVDYSTGNTGRCYYFTNASGWTVFSQGMIMVRAGVGSPVNAVPDTRLSGLPTTFSLDAAYPNPFNPTTVIPYALPRTAAVTLTVYNLLGQKVAVLVNQKKEAGYHTAMWNADQAASGVYIVQINADAYQKAQKIVLLK
jgi:hypothetical protein